jgi:hypothetical protein
MSCRSISGIPIINHRAMAPTSQRAIIRHERTRNKKVQSAPTPVDSNDCLYHNGGSDSHFGPILDD